MSEVLTDVTRTKEMTAVTMSYNEVITWKNPDGSDGSSTTPKTLVLAMADLTPATITELQGNI